MSKADDLQNRAEAFADLSIKFVQGLPDQQIARRMGGAPHDEARPTRISPRRSERSRKRRTNR